MKLSECPDIRAWRTFLEGVMPGPDRSAAESHLARCRLCRERLIALYDEANEATVQQSAPATLKSSAIPSSRQRPSAIHLMNLVRPYVPLALAATIVLGVGLSIFVYQKQKSISEQSGTTGLRQSQNATRELALVNPANGAELSSGKLEFRWSEAGAGARYEFTLTNEKGDIIHQEKLTTNTLLLDSSALRLSAQNKYYWSVIARQADGTSRESGIARFTLR